MVMQWCFAGCLVCSLYILPIRARRVFEDLSNTFRIWVSVCQSTVQIQKMATIETKEKKTYCLYVLLHKVIIIIIIIIFLHIIWTDRQLIDWTVFFD